MLFVGIDPGKKGAVAWMDGERKRIEVRDCPMAGKEYDFLAMRELMSEIVCLDMAVTIEAVHALPTDGRSSAFSFGVGYGAWLALVNGVLRVKPDLVDPKTWKRAMLAGVANDKAMESRILEQRFAGKPIVGGLYGERGGLKDGRVDALWLAEYGRTHWRPEQRRAA